MQERDTSKNSEHYLNSGELFTELVLCRMNGEISDKLSQMFILLSERIANHRHFVRYHHLREDIIAIGQLACLRGFVGFKPYKDNDLSLEWLENMVFIEYNHNYCANSFAYFTTCIRHAIIQHLKHEYRQSNIKNRSRIELGLDASFGYVDMIKEKENEQKAAADDSDEEDFRLTAHAEENVVPTIDY